jgi:hypothetical protein
MIGSSVLLHSIGHSTVLRGTGFKGRRHSLGLLRRH